MDFVGVVFPENLVTILKEEIGKADSDLVVVSRPLRPSDSNLSVGVFSLEWQPVEAEMGGPPDAGLARYGLNIQSLVKHATEEEGMALHTNIARQVRTMLYRSDDLRVRLQQERVTFPDGTIERTSRFGVSTQQFRSNEISGQFVYLSVTNFWVETETV